jgi:hypothetical protein
MSLFRAIAARGSRGAMTEALGSVWVCHAAAERLAPGQDSAEPPAKSSIRTSATWRIAVRIPSKPTRAFLLQGPRASGSRQ